MGLKINWCWYLSSRSPEASWCWSTNQLKIFWCFWLIKIKSASQPKGFGKEKTTPPPAKWFDLFYTNYITSNNLQAFLYQQLWEIQVCIFPTLAFPPGRNLPIYQAMFAKLLRPRCFSTRGIIFNFIVGVVVCANAILMGVEADLGLLGPAGPTWTGGSRIFLERKWMGNGSMFFCEEWYIRAYRRTFLFEKGLGEWVMVW